MNYLVRQLEAQHERRREMNPTRHQNQLWREKVVQWCYAIVDHYNESRDVVYAAVNTLDKFLDRDSCRDYCSDKRKYRLAAVAAIHMAMRSAARRFRLHDLLTKMRGGSITIQDVSQMERIISSSFQRNQTAATPTPAMFARGLIELMPGSVDPATTKRSILEGATFLVELSVYDAFFSLRPPALVAFSSILNALEEPTTTRRIEESEQASFLAEIKVLTGLHPATVGVSELRQRLRETYDQSVEGQRGNQRRSPRLAPAFSPHVIPPDDEVYDSPSCVVSSEDFAGRKVPTSSRKPVKVIAEDECSMGGDAKKRANVAASSSTSSKRVRHSPCKIPCVHDCPPQFEKEE